MSENAKKTTLRQRLLELFRPADEDRQELHYHGRPMTRLIGYLKPHRKVFFLCLALVLAKPQMLPILLGLVYINLRTYSDLFAMPKNWLGLSVVNAVCFALSAAVILRDIARTAKD